LRAANGVSSITCSAHGEEAVGVHHHEARPQVELPQDRQREAVRFAETEAHHVVAPPAVGEERTQFLGAQREHQPRVAQEEHLGRAQAGHHRVVGAEVEDVVIDVPADVVGQVLIAVRGAAAGVDAGAQLDQGRHAVDRDRGADAEHGERDEECGDRDRRTAPAGGGHSSSVKQISFEK
jgi:hypothetical protein